MRLHCPPGKFIFDSASWSSLDSTFKFSCPPFSGRWWQSWTYCREIIKIQFSIKTISQDASKIVKHLISPEQEGKLGKRSSSFSKDVLHKNNRPCRYFLKRLWPAFIGLQRTCAVHTVQRPLWIEKENVFLKQWFFSHRKCFSIFECFRKCFWSNTGGDYMIMIVPRKCFWSSTVGWFW